MLVTLPTFGPAVDPTVQRALKDLADAINALDAKYTQIQQQLATRPRPLTLKEIQQGLSAHGAAPLDITGLVGLPATPTVGP